MSGATVNIEEPNDADVLGGRGGASFRHPGNQIYRNLVNMHKGVYSTVLRTEKLKISRSIVSTIRSRGGRFLEYDDTKCSWYEIEDKKAIEKTSQALREGQPKRRQQMAELGAGNPALGLEFQSANGNGMLGGAGANPALNASLFASMQMQALQQMAQQQIAQEQLAKVQLVQQQLARDHLSQQQQLAQQQAQQQAQQHSIRTPQQKEPQLSTSPHPPVNAQQQAMPLSMSKQGAQSLDIGNNENLMRQLSLTAGRPSRATNLTSISMGQSLGTAEAAFASTALSNQRDQAAGPVNPGDRLSNLATMQRQMSTQMQGIDQQDLMQQHLLSSQHASLASNNPQMPQSARQQLQMLHRQQLHNSPAGFNSTSSTERLSRGSGGIDCASSGTRSLGNSKVASQIPESISQRMQFASTKVVKPHSLRSNLSSSLGMQEIGDISLPSHWSGGSQEGCDKMATGSRKSSTSGASKMSTSSDLISIFSDLSKKIGNVSTRSMAMSEISGIEEEQGRLGTSISSR